MKFPNSYARILLTVAAAGILLAGCDSFLSSNPSDQYTEDNFWQTQEQAQAALTSVYATLRGTPENLIFYSPQLTPNAVRFDNPGGWRAIARGLAQTTNPLFQSTWSDSYEGIGRANTLLGNVDQVNADEAAIEQMKAEAKFLRAYYYSILVNKFGGVPLITSPPNVEEQEEAPRNSESEVVSQILKDLNDAASVLPVENDPGRATKGAALALEARVLLYQSRWEEAAAAAKRVMEMDEYALFPNYRELFMLENEGNSEVIWDIQYKTPEFNHGFDNAVTLHSNVAPTKGLVDAYHMEDGEPISESSLYDPSNPYKNRDPRLYQTIRLVGRMYNGEVNTEKMLDQTGFGTKKFTTYSDSTSMTEIRDSEVNPIVIRYAEMLLTYAEAKNEAVGPVQSVYDAVNKIRRRPSVEMPELQSGLTQDEMRQRIRHERRIELALEGKYYQDIRRWGIAEEVMDGPVYDWQGDVYTNRSFDPDRDYLWAIPSDEIDQNPNLEQNPGW
jgi:hypothetical protein